MIPARSGFEREDTWGYRSLEPNRCCIASIALVLLKTGIVHPPIVSPEDAIDASVEKPGVQVNAQQLATAQKLLLFWRKPAVSLAIDIIAWWGLGGRGAWGYEERELIKTGFAAQVLVGRDGARARRGDSGGEGNQGLGSEGVDSGAESDLSEAYAQQDVSLRRSRFGRRRTDGGSFSQTRIRSSALSCPYIPFAVPLPLLAFRCGRQTPLQPARLAALVPVTSVHFNV